MFYQRPDFRVPALRLKRELQDYLYEKQKEDCCGKKKLIQKK